MREGVSVIIPCYNAAKYLREAIQSVLDQQYDGPLEVVVGDDASTDGSREIALSYGPPVRVVDKPPGVKGNAAANRNRCIRASTQPLVAFLDADDVFLPGHLAALSDVMARRPELGLIYDKSYMMTQDGRRLGPWDGREQPETLTPDDLLLACRCSTDSVMVRRSVFDRAGLFDETLPHSEDYDMWLRIVELFPAAHVAVYGSMYRTHPHQKSLRPALWPTAALVFERAVKRYPYSRRSVRKRRAVLAYRFSQLAFQERRYVRAVSQLFKAALLDPRRAVAEVSDRLRVRLRSALLRTPRRIERSA
jgi:glycosyltransferase involved in cell wall biosynthesis